MTDIHVIETQDNSPIIEKPEKPWKKITILAAIAVLFLSLTLVWNGSKKPYQNTPKDNQKISNTPTITPVDVQNNFSMWPTYTVDDISFKYPENFTVENNKNYITLSNGLTERITTAQPSIVTRPNFDLTMGIETERTIDQVKKENQAEEITLGKNTFYRSYMGAEGSGEYSYYLPVRNNTTLLRFAFTQYREEDINSEDKKQLGYLSSMEEKKLVEEILSTVSVKEVRDISKVPSQYTCPANEYVDCMPGPGPAKPQCEKDYLNWASENCPGFKGGAY